VEGGVEDRDVRDIPELGSRLADRRERRDVVQRRERRENIDLGDDLVVDQRRLDETTATVDDAVTDGLGVLVAVDRTRLLTFDEVPLQARRARVDGQYGQVQSAISGSSSPCSRV
jgi:hypothetical protein